MTEKKTVHQIKLEIKQHSPYPDIVKILAVSKKQTITKIQELMAQGQIQFGENYVQEAVEKMAQLPKNIRWHLIGHLQSNKINSILGKFAYIHSIDSIKIAKLIALKSKEIGFVQKIFIEVNLGQEESKTGFTIDSLKQCWEELIAFDSLKICGFMTLPPPSNDVEKTRLNFKTLRLLQDDYRRNVNTNRHPLNQLSMGTSQDYIIALEEGSTCIRIGTALFGERV